MLERAKECHNAGEDENAAASESPYVAKRRAVSGWVEELGTCWFTPN